MREPALAFEKVAILFSKPRHRMRRKELWRTATRGCLPGYGLHAILTKLERLRMTRITPGTAGTIKTIGLVHLGQRANLRERIAGPEQGRRT